MSVENGVWNASDEDDRNENAQTRNVASLRRIIGMAAADNLAQLQRFHCPA
jgi:hypothetical protein